jgi:hypothetical protein
MRRAKSEWSKFGRLAHCGFAGVVSPEVAELVDLGARLGGT